MLTLRFKLNNKFLEMLWVNEAPPKPVYFYRIQISGKNTSEELMVNWLQDGLRFTSLSIHSVKSTLCRHAAHAHFEALLESSEDSKNSVLNLINRLALHQNLIHLSWSTQMPLKESA